VNARVGGYEVDFLWPAERLAVEADSHRFHRTRSEFERDRAKDLDLRAAGYTVLRFSDRQIARADPRIAAALLTHLGTNLQAVG
jgi:very-short-patch-repair endonuclease